MKSDNLLLAIAVIAVAVSIIGAGVTYNSVSVIQNMLTGYATSTGTINLTVASTASINFTTNNINWGSGQVTVGQTSATLNTAGGATNVTNGNWTGNTAGFVVENIGNVNVSFNLATGKNATTLLGGTSPSYQYNVTNVDPGSCINSTGFILGTFYDVNVSSTGTAVCDKLRSADTNDTVRIDVKLVIPSDTNQAGNAVGDTFTVTFASA
jgi:hypothetical protein